MGGEDNVTGCLFDDTAMLNYFYACDGQRRDYALLDYFCACDDQNDFDFTMDDGTDYYNLPRAPQRDA